MNDKYFKLKDAIVDMFKEEDINQDLKKLIFLIEKETVYSSSVNHEFIIYGRIPKELKLDMEIMEFEDKVMDLINITFGTKDFNEYSSKIYDVKQGLSIGSKFNSLSLTNLNNETVKLERKEGEILIIDFWATWCTFCQEPMQHTIDICNKLGSDCLKDKKIRVIGLSCDEKLTNVSEHIKIKSWEGIEHYNKKSIREELGIKMIPCLCVTNSNGDIVFFGHPRYINIDNVFNNILANKEMTNFGGIDFINKDHKAKKELISSFTHEIANSIANGKVNAFVESYSELNLNSMLIVNSNLNLTVFGEAQKNDVDEIKQKALVFSKSLGVNENSIKYDIAEMNMFSEDF